MYSCEIMFVCKSLKSSQRHFFRLKVIAFVANELSERDDPSWKVANWSVVLTSSCRRFDVVLTTFIPIRVRNLQPTSALLLIEAALASTLERLSTLPIVFVELHWSLCCCCCCCCRRRLCCCCRRCRCCCCCRRRRRRHWPRPWRTFALKTWVS